MDTKDRKTEEILNNYFDGLNKTSDVQIKYQNKSGGLDKAVAALKSDKSDEIKKAGKRLLPAAVFSVMAAAIVVLSFFVIFAEEKTPLQPPDGGGTQNETQTSYVVYNDIELNTFSVQHDILIPSYLYFQAPQAISVLKEYGTQKDVFVKIRYNNGETNETLIFNVVLDKEYAFPELKAYQWLEKTDENYCIGKFRYGTNGNTAYAVFTYMDNDYYLQYSSGEGRLAEIVRGLYETYKRVDSVVIKLDSPTPTAEIQYTKQGYINVDIFPFEATYQNYNFYIEKILKADGTPYEGNLSRYAYIGEDWKNWIRDATLCTTAEIEIGAKIYIYALTETDRVKSNTLEIEIVRIPIERIDFCTPFQSNSVLMGSEEIFTLYTYPADATFNYLNDREIFIEIADESMITIEKINDRQYLLRAASNLEPWHGNYSVNITVTVDGVTKKQSVYITYISPQSIELYDCETGEPLEREITLTRNGVLKTTALVMPQDAHGKISYNYSANMNNFGVYVNYDQNGVLTISKDAPYDLKVYISATQLRESSKVCTISIKKVEVADVTISASRYTISPSDAAGTDMDSCLLFLSAVISPLNADIQAARYTILNLHELPGVFFAGNMIYASSSAPVGKTIEVQAVVDGVESNVIKILIVANSG